MSYYGFEFCLSIMVQEPHTHLRVCRVTFMKHVFPKLTRPVTLSYFWFLRPFRLKVSELLTMIEKGMQEETGI